MLPHTQNDDHLLSLSIRKGGNDATLIKFSLRSEESAVGENPAKSYMGLHFTVRSFSTTGSHKQEVTVHNNVQDFRWRGGRGVGCKAESSPQHLQGAQQKVLASEPPTSTSALIRMRGSGVGTSGCVVLISVRTPLITDTLI